MANQTFREDEQPRPRPKLVKAEAGEEFRKAGERVGDRDVIVSKGERPETIIIGGTK